MKIDFDSYKRKIDDQDYLKKTGYITDVIGNMVVCVLPEAHIGSVCKITSPLRSTSVLAEVVGIQKGKTLLVPYLSMEGIGFDSVIELVSSSSECKIGPGMLGRVINGLGEPIDDKGPLLASNTVSLYKAAINPMDRRQIAHPLDLGVRTINGFLTVGRGQRVAIMAGSGVGKSVIMGMMARSTEADVNVIAMIGERGREVKDFIHDVLGEEGMKKSIVVAVTNDQSALLRLRGAYLATSIAEYFSGQGKQVLMIMDSLTRFAMAQREIGLQAGEPPTVRGYTPSLYPTLSRLLERAGSFESGGSITGLYTVLVEGDDMDEPVADTVRSIVDGHIVLSRKIAQQGTYPAIDILQSISRVMDKVSSPDHLQAAQILRRKLALYRESEDLINIGAYKKGINPEIDESIQCYNDLQRYFKQSLNHRSTFSDSINELIAISLRYSNGK
ncbi:MAG: FliI/YscN family ATPase [Bdellovibrionales bacterium]|nr:FliI/YscN family ATPase [Bdellovibrionales bacterium]